MKVKSKPLLEICIDNYEDAVIAIDSGTDRLECCSSLEEDGLTPDLDMVKAIIAYSNIPIRVMIRPRSGGFCYSNEEIGEMIKEIKRFNELSIEGFVWGCLLPTGQVDRYCCEQLIQACGERPVTFHRAFDSIKDKERAIDQLIKLGIDSILTSGNIGAAVNHLNTLNNLVSQSNNSIKIIAGGGVMPENAKEIISSKIHGIHASLNTKSVLYNSVEKVKRLKSIITI